MAHRFWLMKSEPDVFSITDLEREEFPGWEGARNYKARNLLPDGLGGGDLVLFYPSNAEPSGIAGIAKVHGQPLPDPTQFNKKSDYYDATSPKDEPRWMMRQVAFVERFKKVVPLEVLKADKALTGMPVLAKGQRLSVQTVTKEHFTRVLALAGARTKS